MSDTSDENRTEDYLLDTSESDDLPVTPPEDQPRNTEWGTTAEEQASEETIEQRIMQEETDPDSAYGAPDDEGGLDEPRTVGGDDGDAIPAEDDWVGDESQARPGAIVTPDEGAAPDTEAELVAQDGDDDRSEGPSPEESAMRTVEE